MEISNLSLPATNKFATNYLQQTEEIQQFFHYSYNNADQYEKRLQELESRTFLRAELAAYMKGFMRKFPSSEKVDESLQKLQQPNSVVVIGGQQAGIMTGPLYAIHKVISIVLFAQQKEQELQVPVIPVFWIAGEDHDYDEINHIYVEKNRKLEKFTYPEKVYGKNIVSSIRFDREVCKAWAEEAVASFGETEHTNTLLLVLNKAIESTENFADFFAYIIMELFKDSGLLLVDSGDANFRSLQTEILSRQIEKADAITAAVLSQQQALEAAGYPKMIDVSERAANIFYYDESNKQRILLEFDPLLDAYTDKEYSIQFSKEQLLEMAKLTPERLSNNVVTRPLTQEHLFPTLAFIAGPGEIAYWAELKQAFSLLGIKMPPLMPRMNITILDRPIAGDLEELELSLEDVLICGTDQHKQVFIQSLQSAERDEIFNEAKQGLDQYYKTLKAYVNNETSGLMPLVEKNEQLILKQMNFMAEKLEAAIQFKHDVVISKYDRVGNCLRPLGMPQERVINGLYYANKYGLSFFSELLGLPFEFDGAHKLIKI